MSRLPGILALLISTGLASTASVESDLDLLLREFEHLEEYDRKTQITKRVSDVMQLLTSPLERNMLFRRGTEGEMCQDGIQSSCRASVTCDPTGTSRCNPLCDSMDHGGVAHFHCVCKQDFTAQLCDVTKAEANQKCDECRAQDSGNFCYTTSASKVGYFCYDGNFNLLTVSKRGLEITQGEDEEKLGRIARVLHAYIEANL